MRLGAPLGGHFDDPDQWIARLRDTGYRAAYSPVGLDADETTVRSFRHAAEVNDILIAEVGAWCNPLHPDPATRREAFDTCCRALDLADRIGARCAVNVVGSRSPEHWAGPDPRDFQQETHAMIVDSVRAIVDSVRPRRAAYVLETMPWCLPDSPEAYAELLDAIDRDTVGVHLDLVNLITSPRLFANHRQLIDEFLDLLGHRLRSCHCKDITLEPRLTVHLSEIAPGRGGIDYGYLLTALDRLGDRDLPLLLEHLPAEAYDAAAAHLRGIATQVKVPI